MFHSSEPNKQTLVPVVSVLGYPLMPCRPVRARKLVEQGRAKKCWKKGFFYIQMLVLTEEQTQPVVVGIDPGSKREAFTVKSEHATLLNLQSHACDGNSIKKALEFRKVMRRARRSRTTPCRPPRFNNRSRKGWVPPSTLARWQLKLNILNHLCFLYPIKTVVIEDVKAMTRKGKKQWNSNFSPVQAGKNWLYSRIQQKGLELIKVDGYKTFELREAANLGKTKNKLAETFSAHCVDSWVLANYYIGGHVQPDNTTLLTLKQVKVIRRQLHFACRYSNGKRQRYGGSMSLGIKKGTVVFHPKYGRCLISGNYNGRISLLSPYSLERVTIHAKVSDLKIVAYSPWVINGNYNLPISSKRNDRATRKNIARTRFLQQSMRSCCSQKNLISLLP